MGSERNTGIKANIFSIKRFAVHDGNGIRTTVFFKGCSLSCLWCHNPEGISHKKEIAYFENKCINCGECVKVCEHGAHSLTDHTHYFDRSRCMLCGKCETVCPKQALKIYGTEVDIDEICDVLLQDKVFYDHTGGGVTLSGGECLLQPDACREILKRMRQEGVNTAIDTAGYVPRENIDKVIEYTDLFLYDFKHIDKTLHKKYVGASNELILSNLQYILSQGGRVEIRLPVIPNFNEEYIKEMGEYLMGLNNLQGVRVLDYHNYMGSKYAALGVRKDFPAPNTEIAECAKKTLRALGIKVL